MSEILSQAEIEALLASLTGDGTEAPAASASPTPVREPVRSAAPAPVPGLSKRENRTLIAYEVYDFRRPDKFGKDQLRTMQMLHETFARLFAGSLSAYLRTPVHVDLVSVEQIPYDEYMRSLTSSLINVFSMAPLAGQAILEMEFGLILSMIDRLLGGPGSMEKKSNALTDIEKALAESIINRALKDFRAAWEGIAQFTPKREIMETQSQFVQIVPPNDVVVSILFEVKLGELRGAMSFCIPYLVLKPITDKLSAQRWFNTSVKKSTGKYAPLLARRLEKTGVTCVVRLGSASISVQQLLQLKPGDVIALNRQQNEEVEILIGRNVKFYGRPGIRGKKLAVYISRVNTEVEMLPARSEKKP
ncbi:MAG: flagellar motor switch protein FliM [Chloroherpetonaceae bacterium]|nr:flagellar motor switch protein FliM [Chthonomonadaceae bacterium]MDW8207176.1 flagellar motor switch protein FliM [Chloroherpetonaceae bacterium]